MENVQIKEEEEAAPSSSSASTSLQPLVIDTRKRDEWTECSPSQSSRSSQHSEIEKRRRDKMNALIRELGQLVPAAADRKLDKLTILRLALTHVHVLCSADCGELEATGTSKSLPPSELLALLQQGIANFLTVLDLEHGRIEWVSEGVQETTGWTSEELVGVSWLDLLHPEDIKAFRDLLMSLHTTDRSTENFYSEQVSSSSTFLSVPDSHPGLKRRAHFRMKTRLGGGGGADAATTTAFTVVRGYGFVKYTYASRGLLLIVREVAEQQVRRAFEMKISKQGVILHVEESVYNCMGLLAHLYLGRSYYDFVYEGDLITVSRVHNQALSYEMGKGVSSAYRMRMAAGGGGDEASSTRFLVMDTYWSRFDNAFSREAQFLAIRHEPRAPRTDKEATAEQSALMQLLSGAKKTPSSTNDVHPPILGVARLGTANSNADAKPAAEKTSTTE